MFSTLHAKTKIVIVAIFVVISLIMGLVMSFSLNMIIPKTKPVSKAETKKEEPVVEQPKSTEEDKKEEPKIVKTDEVVKEKIEEKPKKNVAKNQNNLDGNTYTVGEDIQAGLYKLIATNTDSYYKVTDGQGDEELNIVQDMVFFNFAYVQLKQGQHIYVFDAMLQSETQMSAFNSENYVSGQYKIGYDLPEGQYKVTPNGDIGNIKLSSSPNADDTLFSQYIESPATVNVKNGQYLTLNNVGIVKQ